MDMSMYTTAEWELTDEEIEDMREMIQMRIAALRQGDPLETMYAEILMDLLDEGDM